MKRRLLILLLTATISSSSYYLMAQWVQTSGPEGGIIHSITEDDSFFYAGTLGPIFRMQKNENIWNTLHPGNETYVISARSLAISGTTLVAGIDGGGVHRSEDHGVTWAHWVTGLHQTPNVFSLAVSGNDLFAGTDSGVYRSNDHGANWTPTNVGQDSLLVLSLLVKDSTLFAGTSGGGIYRSTNYGTSWAQANNGMTSNMVWSLAMIDTVIFAGTWWSEGIYRSTDDGETWEFVRSGVWNPDVNTLAVLDTNVFAGTHGGVFLSADVGNTWTLLDHGPPVVYCFQVSGSDIIAGTTGGVYFSSNYGDSWSSSNTGLIGTEIKVFARNDTFLFAGTENNGLFRSDNDGANWVNMSSLHYKVSSLVIKGTNLFAGSGLGVIRSSDNGKTWAFVNSGLTRERITALAANGSYLFAGTDSCGVFLSNDNGNNWTPANTGLSDTIVSCLAVNGEKLYVGTESGVSLSMDNGTIWTSINTGLTDTPVQCFTVSSGNLFAGTGDGGVFLFSDETNSWTSVNVGLTDLNILFLASDSTNIFANTGNGIYLSKNNGAQWTPVDNGLINLPVFALDVSDMNLFAGTRGAGVWRRPLHEMITPADSFSIDSIAPELSAADSLLYQPEFIEVTSTEDGVIYLVPENTDKDLSNIRGECLDSTVSVANNAVYVSLSGLDNGAYWLYARDTTCNISENETFTIIGVGIDKAVAGYFKIYPNPSNNHLNIQTKDFGTFLVEITSLNGQLLFSTTIEGSSHQIDLSAFQKGVYLISIRSKDFVTTRKIIKL